MSNPIKRGGNVPLLEAARKMRTQLCTPPPDDPVGAPVCLGPVPQMTAEFRRRADIVRGWMREGLCPSCGGAHGYDRVEEKT